MDKHTLALISIIGSSLDVLGALYLAYDLLGGEPGPLRTLTRAVTMEPSSEPATALLSAPYSAWRAVWRMASPSPGSIRALPGMNRIPVFGSISS